jgi:hypothetical protein
VWKIEPLFYHWLRWKEHLIYIYCNLCDWWLQNSVPISNVAIVNFWHYGKWIWTVLNKLVFHQIILYFLQQFERIIFVCITARTITSFVDETKSHTKKNFNLHLVFNTFHNKSVNGSFAIAHACSVVVRVCLKLAEMKVFSPIYSNIKESLFF